MQLPSLFMPKHLNYSLQYYGYEESALTETPDFQIL